MTEKLPFSALDPSSDHASVIDDALTAVREYMGMPVAYLSRFEGDKLVFRNVSAPGLEHIVKPGDEMALSEVYCHRILSGELPSLIQDTADFPVCQELAVTRDVPIRSHVSLPIRRADGSAYGMFCCLSPEPNHTLNQRDMSVMSTFASLVTRELQTIEETEEAFRAKRDRIDAALKDLHFQTVYQPLVELSTLRVAGLEALTRFDAGEDETPDTWFGAAWETGLGIELELATMGRALEALPKIPEDVYLSINASPDLISDPRLMDLLPKAERHRIAIEVTEHSEALDTTEFSLRIKALQAAGVRIALDDVGAGYSGLQRLSQLSPDTLKVDRTIASGVDQSVTKRAIVTALTQFARETGAVVLVEGVERPEEAATLRDLGVRMGQGWLFGRPVPLEEIAF
jgi:EAL domain-containing protein (putative c-di-GMP-specific phosphodiesterase class I)